MNEQIQKKYSQIAQTELIDFANVFRNQITSMIAKFEVELLGFLFLVRGTLTKLPYVHIWRHP